MPYNPGKTPFIVVTGMGDGLGGATKPSQPSIAEKSSKIVAKPTGDNTSRLEYGENGGVDLIHVTNMETSNMG